MYWFLVPGNQNAAHVYVKQNGSLTSIVHIHACVYVSCAHGYRDTDREA